jgi:hypothetical protein
MTDLFTARAELGSIDNYEQVPEAQSYLQNREWLNRTII